jgi:serine/threonine-protein kinase
MKKVLKSFGRYLLLDHLAQGGMAEIFRAWAPSVDGGGRLIVLKCVQPDFGQDNEFLQMFRSEIRVSIGLNHPNIVQLYDFGEVSGRPYIAMELVEGKSLKQIIQHLLQQKKLLPVEFAAYSIEQIAMGLHYAHIYRDRTTGEALNIIHRDISPQNLLISYTGNAKIIDFGIAKAASNRQTTRAGIIKGKPSYLSPEQISGEVLDGRSDVFSLGAVLWETLTGRKLFAGDSDVATIRLIDDCDRHVKPPSSLNPDVPPELDAITLKALANDREKRYKTAEEMQRALHRAIYAMKPDFDPSDFSTYLHDIFKKEIEQEHKDLQQLNMEAKAISKDDSFAAIPSLDVSDSVSGLNPVSGFDALLNNDDIPEAEESDEDETTVRSNKIPAAPGDGPSQVGNGENRAGLGGKSTGARDVDSKKASKLSLPKIDLDSDQLRHSAEAPLIGQIRGKKITGKKKLPLPRLILTGLIALAGVVYLGPLMGIPIPFMAEESQQLPEYSRPPVAENHSHPIQHNPQPAPVQKPKGALLRLNLIPAGGPISLSINGQVLNPSLPIELPLHSPLKVSIQKHGFKPVTRQLTVNSAADFPLEVRFEPEPYGLLTLHSTPTAKVQLLMKDMTWVLSSPIDGIKLPPGTYHVRLVNEILGMEKSISFRLDADKSVIQEVNLSVVR